MSPVQNREWIREASAVEIHVQSTGGFYGILNGDRRRWAISPLVYEKIGVGLAQNGGRWKWGGRARPKNEKPTRKARRCASRRERTQSTWRITA